jgi:hypothetical protein
MEAEAFDGLVKAVAGRRRSGSWTRRTVFKAVGTATATSLLALVTAPGSEAKATKPPKTKKPKKGSCLPPGSPYSFDNVEACCSQFCSTNGCCAIVDGGVSC